MPKMLELDPDFKAFIEALNSSGVRYLLLGGYAVNFYGHHRFTQDIDFWIATDDVNAQRVIEAMHRFGFGHPPSIAELQDPKRIHQFGVPPVRIDLLASPTGVDFEGCYARRRPVMIDDVEVSLIDLADLRANKLASGRDKDLIDLKRLPSSS